MLLTAEDVMRIFGVSKTKSYDIILQLNKELEEQGYLTLRGKVEKSYLQERFRLTDTEGQRANG